MLKLRQSRINMLRETFMCWFIAFPLSFLVFDSFSLSDTVAIVIQLSILLLGFLFAIPFIKTKTELIGETICHKQGKHITTLKKLKKISYYIYEDTIFFPQSIKVDVQFHDFEGRKIELSYSTYKKKEIRKFISLCLKNNPECKIEKTIVDLEIKEEQLHKYI